MDYMKWAEQYETDAAKIHDAIERKKDLKRKWVTADQRQQLNGEIAEFRRIYRELLSIAHSLRERAKDEH